MIFPLLTGSNVVEVIRNWKALWNNVVRDELRRMTPIQGAGCRIERLATGTVFSAGRSGGTAHAALAEVPDGGPFAVTVTDEGAENSPKWVVKMHNSSSESGIAGMVTIGSYRETVQDRKWDARQGVVYLDITCDGTTGEYSVIFALEEKIPETTGQKRFVLRIAEIAYDAETELYTASQVHPCGDIEVLGRWVK